MLNCQKLCQPLFENLSERTREVIYRRFGLRGGERETLEAIGGDFGLTRERVRQIEEEGIKRIKKNSDFSKFKNIFQILKKYLQNQGGLKREDIFFQVFNSQPNSGNWLFFILILDGRFFRFISNKRFHTFWAHSWKIFSRVEKIIKYSKEVLEKNQKPLTFKELSQKISGNQNLLRSSLEASKEIISLQKDKFGLKSWPEINPRGVKDLAYLVFKQIGKPLHFNEVAKSIDGFLKPKNQEFGNFSVIQANASLLNRKTNPQTVHNELIKDPRFILVGRGTYALSEWGFKPGVVKEVISQTLREAKRPLSKEEVVKKVLSQRIVKENTVLLNLHNKNYFLRTDDGKYTIREA